MSDLGLELSPKADSFIIKGQRIPMYQNGETREEVISNIAIPKDLGSREKFSNFTETSTIDGIKIKNCYLKQCLPMTSKSCKKWWSCLLR